MPARCSCPDTLARARALGLRRRDRLADNDGYGFFEALGDLVVTGPTLTNVNDFRAILIGRPLRFNQGVSPNSKVVFHGLALVKPFHFSEFGLFKRFDG